MTLAFFFAGLLNAAVAANHVSRKKYGWATWFALCAICSFVGPVQ